MKFELPKLNYEYDALEPYIDAETMRIHHTKHHQAYTNKFNEALAEVTGIEKLSANEIIARVNEVVPESVRDAARNNGGGYVNHNLFFDILGANNHEIGGKLHEAIIKDFGSVEVFKEQFENAAKTQFGSGWAFLVVDELGRLKIVKKPNQNSPLTDGQTPILALDIWEHAYYLKYQNRRPDYVSNFWNVVDFSRVEKRYLDALKGKKY
ncbi:MAG: superoxide dismutase [Spirochaetales bacterium]